MGIFAGTNNFRGYGYGIELPDGFLPVAIPRMLGWAGRALIWSDQDQALDRATDLIWAAGD